MLPRLKRPLSLLIPAVVLALLASAPKPWGPLASALLSIYLIGTIVLLAAILGDQLWQDRYWITAWLTGQRTDIQQSRVRALFDSYAARFDQELRGDLGYQGPELAKELLLSLEPPRKQWRIADLGCGTGLAGSILLPWASSLAGCDLSQSMLRRAEARGLYNDLSRQDLVVFLASRSGQFDLAIALDVLIYIDNSWRFFAQAAHALGNGGLLLATTELPEAAQIDKKRGRRREAREVTLSVAAAAGFELIGEKQAALRFEAGVPVPAGIYLWRLGKTHMETTPAQS